MGKNTTYFVDGKPFATDEDELTVADVLKQAGMPGERFSVVSEEGAEYRDPSERIAIREGDKFQVKRGDSDPAPVEVTIRYQVNGEDLFTKENPLTVETILRNAGSAASVDANQIGSYFLENIASGQRYENLSDRVTVKDDDRFLAVHVGKTPVA